MTMSQWHVIMVALMRGHGLQRSSPLGTHLHRPCHIEDSLELWLDDRLVVLLGGVFYDGDERWQHQDEHVLVINLFCDHREDRAVEHLLQCTKFIQVTKPIDSATIIQVTRKRKKHKGWL